MATVSGTQGKPSLATDLLQISTANAGTDGTGTLGTVKTAGANGSRVQAVEIQAAGTVTNGMIRLFIDDGVNKRYLDDVIVTATVPSATVKAWRSTWIPLSGALDLPNGWSLKASTVNAEAFNLLCRSVDY